MARLSLRLTALLPLFFLGPHAFSNVRVGKPVSGGGFGTRVATPGAAQSGGVTGVKLGQMPLNVGSSLPSVSAPTPNMALPQSAVPAAVAAAEETAQAKQEAALHDMKTFLRRAVAVERRNADLKVVQDKMKELPFEERGELIAESNRLQNLELDDLIERYFPQEQADSAMSSLMGYVKNAEVTINIDPNMKLKDGRSILDGLFDEGVYKNYSETGVTQGLETRKRAEAEDRLFKGLENAPPSARPKYGSLNLTQDPAGGAPRYSDYTNGRKGVYFALKNDVKNRSTLTARDTLDNMGMSPVGTLKSPAPALQDMPREHLLALSRWESGGRQGPRPDIRLNPEVQIFDAVRLDADVHYLAAHRDYKGTPAEEGLKKLAAKYGLELRWY